MRNKINDEYFEWLFDSVCDELYSNKISYRKLLTRMHRTEFRYSIPKDQNRAEDGLDLRRRFALLFEHKYPYDMTIDSIDGPCSVLEMMVALSIRCEENIMDDPHMGNRTTQWFWTMVKNLGLSAMYDSRFDRDFVDDILARFLDREYEPDGRGGLFTIRNCDCDLRTVEIWYQLCWYLDYIT